MESLPHSSGKLNISKQFFPISISVEFRRAYVDTSCHILYKLRIAPCFALPQSNRYSDFARSRFILIPVAFEIAYSLLRALRVRRSCLRFRRAYTVNQLRSAVTGSLLDAFRDGIRPANMVSATLSAISISAAAGGSAACIS